MTRTLTEELSSLDLRRSSRETLKVSKRKGKSSTQLRECLVILFHQLTTMLRISNSTSSLAKHQLELTNRVIYTTTEDVFQMNSTTHSSSYLTQILPSQPTTIPMTLTLKEYTTLDTALSQWSAPTTKDSKSTAFTEATQSLLQVTSPQVT